MSLKEELRKLAELTKDSSKEVVAERIRNVVKLGGEEIYQILRMLIKEELERGYTKKLSLAELLEKLPWEKSTAIEKMQEGVVEGVVKHEKSMYKLNKENELVKRIWNYYNIPSYQKEEKLGEIRKLRQKKQELEQELKEVEGKGKYQDMTKKEEKEFKEQIKMEWLEASNTKEDLEVFIRRNLAKVMGIR